MVNQDEMAFEVNPLAIYQTFKLEGGKRHHKFRFGVDNTGFNGAEILSQFGESEITKRLLSKGGLCNELFHKTGINFPNCCIGIEIKKEELINNWPHSLPGDIDIIAANYINESWTIDSHSLTSYQIKIRKIREYNDLKSFGTGTGTEQTVYSSKMGFNRNYLLHIIIREPRPIHAHQSESWSLPHNADFFEAFKASHGLIKEKIRNKPFGYGLLGWGQAKDMDWRISGAYSIDIVKEAPFLNDFDSNYRNMLHQRFQEIFSKRGLKKPVFYHNKKHWHHYELIV